MKSRSLLMTILAVVMSITLNVSAQSNWTLRNPTITGATLSKVIWAGNQFVAVGGLDSSAILSSSNGIIWTKHPVKNTNNLNGIAWTGTKLVAVGNYGTILASVDQGFSWTPCSSGVYGNLKGIAWSGQKFIATGYNGIVLSSPDGNKWTSNSLGATTYLNGIIWADSQFVIVGYAADSAKIFTSADGISWTTRYSGPLSPGGVSPVLISVAWNGKLFAAAGYGGIISSPDGITWSVSQNTNYLLSGIAWNGSRFAAVGFTTAYYKEILTSTDGITWDTVSSGVMEGLFDVASNGSIFVAVGVVGTVITSSDGVSWKKSSSGIARNLFDIASNGFIMVAVGGDGQVAASLEGTIWLPESSLIVSYARVVSNGQQFLASSDNGLSISADEGMNWKPDNNASTVYYQGSDMVWAGTKYVAVGTGKKMATSVDGVTWTPCSSQVAARLSAVAWNGTQIVAVGDSGTIISSTDGVSWANHSLVTVANLHCIVWAGTKFVVSGTNTAVDTVWTSPDGAVWTKNNPGTSVLTKMIWSGKQIVALSPAAGRIYSSRDGSNWSVRASGGSLSSANSIIWSGSLFVLVGGSGLIMTAPEDFPDANNSRLLSAALSKFPQAVSVISTAKDRLVLSCTLAQPSPLSVRLHDVAGRIIFSAADNASSAGTRIIRMPAKIVAPGIYFLELRTNATVNYQRILIK